jgi:hypothetical protein
MGTAEAEQGPDERGARDGVFLDLLHLDRAFRMIVSSRARALARVTIAGTYSAISLRRNRHTNL